MVFRGERRFGGEPMVRLAFWKTTVDAYRFVFTEPVTVIRAGWGFLALICYI